MKKKAIIVSGYFNPIHKGHLEYFNNAKALADELFVIVNNEHQRALKGSKEFQKEEERMIIVSNIKAVDKVILSIDKDRTVCATIKMIAEKYGGKYELVFANGGDQNNETIPEKPICEEVGITLIDGLGDKIQSSSWLLNETKNLIIKSNYKDHYFEPISDKDIEFIYFLRKLDQNGFLKESNRKDHFEFIKNNKDVTKTYFSFSNKHAVIGYYRYYSKSQNEISIESLITNPMVPVEPKIRMDLEFKNMIFENFPRCFITFEVNSQNTGVIYMHKKSGATITGRNDNTLYFKLTKSKFYEKYI